MTMTFELFYPAFIQGMVHISLPLVSLACFDESDHAERSQNVRLNLPPSAYARP